MIDSRSFITDAQLNDAYGDACLRATSLIDRTNRLRRVAEFAVAAYLGATMPDKLEQLDRVTAAVERFTGEVLT